MTECVSLNDAMAVCVTSTPGDWQFDGLCSIVAHSTPDDGSPATVASVFRQGDRELLRLAPRLASTVVVLWYELTILRQREAARRAGTWAWIARWTLTLLCGYLATRGALLWFGRMATDWIGFALAFAWMFAVYASQVRMSRTMGATAAPPPRSKESN